MLITNSNVRSIKLYGSVNCANCENRQRHPLPLIQSTHRCAINLSSRRHFHTVMWASCSDECTCPECTLYFEVCYNSWTTPPELKKGRTTATSGRKSQPKISPPERQEEEEINWILRLFSISIFFLCSHVTSFRSRGSRGPAVAYDARPSIMWLRGGVDFGA